LGAARQLAFPDQLGIRIVGLAEQIALEEAALFESPPHAARTEHQLDKRRPEPIARHEIAGDDHLGATVTGREACPGSDSLEQPAMEISDYDEAPWRLPAEGVLRVARQRQAQQPQRPFERLASALGRLD